MAVSARSKMRFIAVLLILLGVGLAVGSWFVWRARQRIRQEGAECLAVASHTHKSTDGRGRTSHFVELHFELADGTTWEVYRQVPEEVHARALADRELLIRYDPAAPDKLVFVDFPYRAAGRFTVAAILMVIGAIIACFVFRPTPRSERPP